MPKVRNIVYAVLRSAYATRWKNLRITEDGVVWKDTGKYVWTAYPSGDDTVFRVAFFEPVRFDVFVDLNKAEVEIVDYDIDKKVTVNESDMIMPERGDYPEMQYFQIVNACKKIKSFFEQKASI